MAVTFDSFAEDTGSGSGAGGGGGSFSFTNTAGNILFCACYEDGEVVGVESVSYGGVQLTELYDVRIDAALLWVGYLLNPATGSNTLTVTGANFTTVGRRGVITFRGARAIGGSAGNSWQNSQTSPRNVTVTVQGTSGLVVDFFNGSRVTSGNATTPQTEKMNNTGNWNGGVNHLAGMSYKSHTGSNTQMQWESLSYQSSNADTELFAQEILPQEFAPRMILM